MKPSPFPRYVSPSTIAAQFGVSVATARRWIRAGKFGDDYLALAVENQERLRVRESAVDDFIARQIARATDPKEMLREAMSRPGRR